MTWTLSARRPSFQAQLFPVQWSLPNDSDMAVGGRRSPAPCHSFLDLEADTRAEDSQQVTAFYSCQYSMQEHQVGTVADSRMIADMARRVAVLVGPSAEVGHMERGRVVSVAAGSVLAVQVVSAESSARCHSRQHSYYLAAWVQDNHSVAVQA